MSTSNKPKKQENGVRLSKSVLKKVKDHKKKTGIAIGRFVEDAVLEKLARDSK